MDSGALKLLCCHTELYPPLYGDSLFVQQNGKGLFLAGDGVEALFHQDDIEGIVQHARTEMNRIKDDAAAPTPSLVSMRAFALG